MRAIRAVVFGGAALLAAARSPIMPAALPAQVPVPVSPARALGDSTLRTPATRWQFDQFMGGLTYGAPLKWALSYGMGWVRESEQRDWCFLGAAKMGFGGASLNVGLANSLGHWGSGVALTAGVLRTFNDPLGALAKRTYVGGNLHVWPLLALGGDVGYYVPIGRDAPGTKGKGLLVWSTGFGF